MLDEYFALIKNQTWTLVFAPNDSKIIGCKWVFTIKENPNGTIQKYKARLVAKGYHQRQGFDFEEVFNLVIKPSTIRVILTIALSKGRSIRLFDFNNAF